MELGMPEIALILFVALLVYGGNLPQVAIKVGRIVGEFKKTLRQTTDLVRIDLEEEERRTRRAPRTPPRAPERLAEDLPADTDDPEPASSSREREASDAYATEDISQPDSSDADPSDADSGGEGGAAEGDPEARGDERSSA